MLVTGGTGFVGSHLVSAIVDRGYSVRVVVRDLTKLNGISWKDDVDVIHCDIYDESFEIGEDERNPPDILVHLAWPGLPNYKRLFHIADNLPQEIKFLRRMALWGVPHFIIAGTCLEYGCQYGPLSEDHDTRPDTPYGLAKDTLRRVMQCMQAENGYVLQWMRLFYIYGEGQSGRSLIPQLRAAISEGKETFDMSRGDQLRDFLSINAVIERFLRVMEAPEVNGVINCCSGEPVSVADLASRIIKENRANISLNRGAHPYPEYEPLAFWGVPEKLRLLGFD